MKRILMAVVMSTVSMVGMSQTNPDEHVAIAGEKLDSGLGTMVYGEKLDSGLADVKPGDWKKYVK